MPALWPLVRLSSREPRRAARMIIGWQLPRGANWSALVLFGAINVMITTAPTIFFPPDVDQIPERMDNLVRLLTSPLLFFVLLCGFLVLLVHALVWMGRALGGTGGLDEMAAVWAWMQGLRALAQLILVTLTFVVPGLAGLVALAIFVLGLWIMVNFVAEAQNFDSTWQAFGVLMAVFVGLMLTLMMLLTLSGAANMGAA